MRRFSSEGSALTLSCIEEAGPCISEKELRAHSTMTQMCRGHETDDVTVQRSSETIPCCPELTLMTSCWAMFLLSIRSARVS